MQADLDLTELDGMLSFCWEPAVRKHNAKDSLIQK